MSGISIGQLLTDTIPEPTWILNWGEDISPDVMQALRTGETAILNNMNGEPYAHILIDEFGTIRERRIE